MIDQLKARARKIVGKALSVSPTFISYPLRKIIEKIVYNATPIIDDLPPIFHYWSDRYVRTKFEAIGFSSPNDFFHKSVADRIRSTGEIIRILSVGAGRCEMEVDIAKALVTQGFETFSFTCIDINGRMLRSANSSAIARGIGSKFTFREADIAKQPLRGTYDVVIANQCLHHFVALEAIFDKIYASLIRGGLFLTSDVIGRNGHQLWPEALVEVESIWNRLADKYKYDKTQGKVSRRFINYNHANVGFEGIRAQDVLPLLVERFEFEVFAPYACIIMPFVERRFGWNFDRENETDRKFIDEVTARDEVLLASGKVKPTQLLARMSNVPPSSLITTAKVSIRDCVRTPG